MGRIIIEFGEKVNIELDDVNVRDISRAVTLLIAQAIKFTEEE